MTKRTVTQKHKIIIASLLHDIGKILQRAKETYVSKNFKQEEMSHFLPSNKGRFSHYHGFYTYEFLDKEFPWPDFLKGDKDEISAYAGHHHISSNKFEEILVTIGDRISSGHDRVSEEEKEDAVREKEINEFGLRSPAFLMKEYDREDEIFFKIQTLKNLKINSEIYTSKKDFTDDYRKLNKELFSSLKNIQGSCDINEFIIKLISVLEDCWSLFPSAVYKAEPTISLYDHSRLTGAIAEVLYEYYKDQQSIIEDKFISVEKVFNAEDKVFRIVSGDISGIQKFILGLEKTNKGEKASKLIRGKSFYIQALTKSIALDIQNNFDLSPLTQLIDAGGNFSLLIPNIENQVEKLKNYIKSLEDYFFEMFNGELTPVIAVSDAYPIKKLLSKGEYSDILFDLVCKIKEGKHKKYNDVVSAGKFFMDIDKKDYSKDLCEFCNKEPVKSKEDKCCPICNDAIDMGTKLAHQVSCFVYYRGVKKDKNLFQILPNIYVAINEEDSIKLDFADVLWVESDFTKIDNDKKYPYSNVVAHIPKKQNSSGYLTLEEISEKARGRSLLSLFKADVDNLGYLFSNGVKDNYNSISSQVFLSRMISLFWGRMLKSYIMEECYDRVYICYSGGDDVALIGDYETILNLALKLERGFALYMDDSLKFSASIYHFKNKYPVKKVIKVSEENLKISKKTKPSICVFNEIVTWDDLQKSKEIADFVYEQTQKKEKPIPIAFWYRLLDFWKKSKYITEQKGNIPKDFYLIKPQITYDLNRRIKEKKIDETMATILHDKLYMGDLIAVNNTYRKVLVGLNYGLSYIRNIKAKQ
jgi:CRISPR-associated protein Csm1